MGIFSKLFSQEGKSDNVRKRKGEPDVFNIPDEDERMNWAIEKAKLTLHYFEKCLQSPKPDQQYFSIKVKIKDDDKIEHIWLTDPNFDIEGNLFGIVGNEPLNLTNVKIDQEIGIDRKFISDWMIIENGRLIGGYTIRAIREVYRGKALKNLDKSLGMYIDEGEDYFIPNFETPEGAILSIEEAYNDGDLDKVIECKDFIEEAKLMLKKIGKFVDEEEVIKASAEALRLSFIKGVQENGLPNFKKIKRAFPKREKVSDNHYIITEVCIYPDGQKSIQRLNTYKTEKGWKVLNLED